jgi:hypothetical protein
MIIARIDKVHASVVHRIGEGEDSWDARAVGRARSMRSARPGALICTRGRLSLMCRPTLPYGAPYNDSRNAGMKIDADSGKSMKSSAATAGFKSAMRSCNRVYASVIF